MPMFRFQSRPPTKNSESRPPGALEELPNKAPWQESSACAHHEDPDLWFSLKMAAVNKAKQVCKTECPVTLECLGFIMENPQFGTWAGMTERERNAAGMRRRMQ